MTAISKHTGQNIGGIRSIQFAYPSDISAFTIFPDYKIFLTFVEGANWKDLYATASSFSGGGSSEITPAGTLYSYDFVFRCPKDRLELINEFHSFAAFGVILRVTDGNSLVRIYGTPSNPMTIKGKLLLPGQVQGYNGYEIALSLSTPDPAYMEK
ncbi:MAG: hypothetical protein M0Q51_06560 [Bacteroidales bacterium]|nr:hypothetical protein [Bacteroidales bacterium]